MTETKRVGEGSHCFERTGSAASAQSRVDASCTVKMEMSSLRDACCVSYLVRHISLGKSLLHRMGEGLSSRGIVQDTTPPAKLGGLSSFGCGRLPRHHRTLVTFASGLMQTLCLSQSRAWTNRMAM